MHLLTGFSMQYLLMISLVPGDLSTWDVIEKCCLTVAWGPTLI